MESSRDLRTLEQKLAAMADQILISPNEAAIARRMLADRADRGGEPPRRPPSASAGPDDAGEQYDPPATGEWGGVWWGTSYGSGSSDTGNTTVNFGAGSWVRGSSGITMEGNRFEAICQHCGMPASWHTEGGNA